MGEVKTRALVAKGSLGDVEERNLYIIQYLQRKHRTKKSPAQNVNTVYSGFFSLYHQNINEYRYTSSYVSNCHVLHQVFDCYYYFREKILTSVVIIIFTENMTGNPRVVTKVIT